MAKKVTKNPLLGAMLWDLKLAGDINENHEGGDAVATLQQRLLDRGVKITREQLSKQIYDFYKRGLITKLASKNRAAVAIRLPDSVSRNMPYDNPFLSSVEVVPYAPINVQSTENSFELLRELSLTKRVELIAFLSQSVQEDIQTFKLGVVESL